MKRHYVYALCYPDGTPFYIGKGVDNRKDQHRNGHSQVSRNHQTQTQTSHQAHIETRMIEKLIAAAVLSLGTSAIGKAKAKYREKHPKLWPWEIAAELKKLSGQQLTARLARCSRNDLEHICRSEGMTATWCKNRVELETFLADRYSTRKG